MDLGFLPLAKALSAPYLFLAERSTEEDVTQPYIRRTSWQGCHCASFPKSEYVFGVLLIYSFHAPFPRAVRIPRRLLQLSLCARVPAERGPLMLRLLRNVP